LKVIQIIIVLKKCFQNTHCLIRAGNAIILVLTKNAQTDFFKKHINAGKHNFLIADECHKLWAKGPNTILNLPWDDCPRLALSATPEERVNIFDTYEETEEIEDNPKVDVIKFFGGKNDNGEYTPNDIFTLHDAIEKGILKKYYYHIKFAYLTDNEVDDYLMVTKRLNKYMNIKFPTPEQRRRRDAAIFERLQIISVAEDKKRVVLDVIDDSKNKDDAVNLNDQNWVVYVGVGPVPKNEEGNPITSEKEIVKMEETLIEWRQKRKHFEIWPFHSSRSREELNNSLEKFTYLGGVLLSKRMFDEGIDVPACLEA
jgi:DNA or RNA helicases of superfamily II